LLIFLFHHKAGFTKTTKYSINLKKMALTKSAKNYNGETQYPAASGRRENTVSPALLVRQGITAGKTQHNLCTQQQHSA